MLQQYTPRDCARFWSYVDRTGDCWLWTGPLDKNGYGKFWLSQQNGVRQGCRRAPRLAWEIVRGEIPSKLTVTMIEDVREMYTTGQMTQLALAAKHGVSPAMIWNILQNRQISKRFWE